ncbi:MAG: hypothetical protein MIO87_02530, partial [Methanomassiliicoccales archaeon]|nr:hypothetical protein [Methanomassiliicoccales archaeon]
TVEFNGDIEQGKVNVLEAILALEEIKSGLDNDLLDPIEVEMKEVSNDFTPKMKPIVDKRRRYDS